MTTGLLPSTVTTEWLSICLNREIIEIYVRPPACSFANKSDGNGGRSDDLNLPSQFGWKSEHDWLMISSTFEMYFNTVISLVPVQDSFSEICRFRPLGHISKTSWMLACLCGFLCFTASFISKFVSVCVVSDCELLHVKILVLAGVNRITMAFSWSVSPVVLDCLQPMTDCLG